MEESDVLADRLRREEKPECETGLMAREAALPQRGRVAEGGAVDRLEQGREVARGRHALETTGGCVGGADT